MYCFFKNLILVTLSIGLFYLVSSVGLAQGGLQGNGEFLPFLDNDHDHSQFVLVGMLMVTGILGLLLGLAIAGSKNKKGRHPEGCVDHLFLKVSYSRGKIKSTLSGMNSFPKVKGKRIRPAEQEIENVMPTKKEESGYLRSLRLGEACLLCCNSMKRNDSLNIDLSSLPEFPLLKTKVEGEVVSCKTLGGSPEYFLVKVKFDGSNIQDGLRDYIDYLAKKSHQVIV